MFSPASPLPGGGPVPLRLSPVVSGVEPMETDIVQLDPKEKMTYTEQASKRKHCQRLTRYSMYMYMYKVSACSVCI